VNVLSWNSMAPAMLASGADDGGFRIWDLRHFAAGGFVANFSYHTAPVTSIEWSRFDSSTLATSAADHQIAVWDLAVERDAEEEAAAMADAHNALPPAELPPQLMFVHQGQRDVKELHWHPQVPGLIVSTAANGFQVWKPQNQVSRFSFYLSRAIRDVAENHADTHVMRRVERRQFMWRSKAEKCATIFSLHAQGCWLSTDRRRACRGTRGHWWLVRGCRA
jgi:WD40 repeat protein